MKYKVIPTILILFYILGSYKGYLALFDANASEPRQIYPCRIDMLPQSDQEKLLQGIRVRDQEKLAGLLEDYLS